MRTLKPRKAEIRPIYTWDEDFEWGLKAKLESAAQDLIALFIVADEEAADLPTPEAWQNPSMEMSERDRRWRKWQRS